MTQSKPNGANPAEGNEAMEAGSKSNAAQGDLGPPFEELAKSYNFQNLPHRLELFVRLLVQEAARFPHPVKAADVGCGKGIGLDPALSLRVRATVDELWGIEPDSSVEPAAGLFDHFQHALMETAELPERALNLVYCAFVMEHVADPAAFLRAVHRCLAPGGSFMYLTVNGAHYFARMTGICRALRIEEAILRLLRGKFVDEYHYPTVYRFNRPKQIDRYAEETGFLAPEYVFLEDSGPDVYLPGPLRPILLAMHAKRRLIRKPSALMELIGRLRKPE